MAETLAQDRLHVTVDLLILTVREGRLSLWLSRRLKPPFQGCWALPGRMMALGDSAETTARKLLEEMLPIRGAFLEQLYTFTELNRDPRGRVVSIAYLAAAPWSRLEPLVARGGTDAGLFDVRLDSEGLSLMSAGGQLLTRGDLAFDHGRIVEAGVQRLRGKIDYTDIAFRFLNDPGAFSLGELQSVFEAVLDKSVDGSNFRRTIQNRYEEAGRIVQIDRTEPSPQRRRGRPAAMYRLTD